EYRRPLRPQATGPVGLRRPDERPTGDLGSFGRFHSGRRWGSWPRLRRGLCRLRVFPLPEVDARNPRSMWTPTGITTTRRM
ncbi:MAG: hypothetical protein AVDCRST_MAG19-4494, partial [uncultured Thermomicrobiales bacterium]